MVATPGTSSPTAHRLTVLLADDAGSSEPWHNTVSHLLSPLGIHLIYANTGREALRVMESSHVHVAVLDQRLPQLGGLQVIKLAREHIAQRPTPTPATQPTTILLAEHLTTPLLHDALGLSVFTVLTKPVNYPQLLDALARAMKRFHNSQWPTTQH